jgi:VanZ family protein
MDHVPDVLTWRRRVWVWGPAVLQMAAIFVISGTPNLKEIPGGFSDLTGHFAGYALLGALVLRATAGARWAGVTASAAALAWMFCAIYGISDEFHQSFVPGRATTSAKREGGPP